MSEKQIWTIGHSTRTIDAFIALLHGCEIETVADVRRFPGSRKYPQFNSGELSKALAAAGLAYVHFPELGGRRTTRKDSHNLAWRSAAFRGYADYMETPEFRSGIQRLIHLALANRTAILCAEAVWWRCHRSLIADYLKASGWKVWHIMEEKKVEEHPFTSAARIVDGRLCYAAPTAMQLNLGETAA